MKKIKNIIHNTKKKNIKLTSTCFWRLPEILIAQSGVMATIQFKNNVGERKLIWVREFRRKLCKWGEKRTENSKFKNNVGERKLIWVRDFRTK